MSFPAIPDCFKQFGALMHLAEVDMASVFRWGPFRNLPPGVTDQSSGLHSFSLALVTSSVVHDLRPHVQLDEARLLRAILVHDLSEGILGRDIDRRRKTVASDAAEVRAFCQFAGPMANGNIRRFQEDFLLQFCLTHGEAAEFDAADHAIMAWLRTHYRHEAIAFRVLEELEYQVFAMRQYLARGNTAILEAVVRNNLENFKTWADQLPGFSETYGVAEYCAWCRAEYEQIVRADPTQGGAL